VLNCSYPFNLLTEYFIKGNSIDISKEYEIESVPAIDLFVCQRFDLMAKWIYIYAKEKCIDVTWGRDVYLDNINAFSAGTFVEPGSPDKNSAEKYLKDFDRLIESIRDDGFDDKTSIVPVGKDNTLLDGSHRIAAAAYFNKNVTIIHFPELKRDYDFRYFRSLLMTDTHMGYMSLYYTKLRNNLYMACIWPRAERSLIDNAEKLLSGYRVYYSQELYLTYRGLCNFMVQIYGHQEWVGNIDNKFVGVNGKAKACWERSNPVITYLFEAEDISEVIELKKKIREIFKIENHSVHISDNINETRYMAELLYNPNSVDHLNNANPFEYDHVFKKLIGIKDTINDNGLDLDRFIIDSSAVLEVYGIRKAEDIDYLSDYKDIPDLGDGIDNHESQLQYYECNVKDYLYNPQKRFFFDNVKFLALSELLKMKENRAEKKDAEDIKLCDRHFKTSEIIPYKYRISTIEEIIEYQKRTGDYFRGVYSLWEYRKVKLKRIIKKCLLPIRYARDIVKRKSRGLYIRRLPKKIE